MLVGIVLLDLATKLLANHFLPYEEYVAIMNDHFFFCLTYNLTPSNFHLEQFTQDIKNKNLYFFLNIGNAFMLLGYYHYIKNKAYPKRYKIGTGFLLYIINNVVVDILLHHCSDIAISVPLFRIITMALVLFFWGYFFYHTTNRYVRLFELFIIGCGIGNGLSLFYPPYGVIDFVYIPFLYTNNIMGIFNVADVFWALGVIGLMVSGIVFLLHWLYKRFTSKKNTQKEIPVNFPES
jgi:lipoprotein signal peptidase